MGLAATYAGRSVFVTGHTGFKGSWLAEWLGSLGADVSGFALAPPTEPNLFDALGLAGRMNHVVADVREAETLSDAVRTAQPEVVFHLAARALVRRAYEQPTDTFGTNVMGTVNVLDAVRSCTSVRAVVIVTSDKVYDNPETGRPFREDDRLGGLDPYGTSKAAAELVAAAYRSSYFDAGPMTATVRAGNVIGGGDWAPDRIIPDSVRALVAAQPILVRNPDAIRPWQHVLEPLSGYLQLGAALLEGGDSFVGAWNFGPTAEVGEKPVRWVVDRFIEEWGGGAWAAPQRSGQEPHEAQRLSLDSSKARDRLGWAPVWNAERAVQRTAAWYREYYRAPARARELVQDQLRAYQEDARGSGLTWAARDDGAAIR
jgi:CDP-glucose 4,6-dehydratase